MKKTDIKPGTKIIAKDFDDEESYRGQITRVTTSGFYIRWEHCEDETEHHYEGKEYEELRMID